MEGGKEGGREGGREGRREGGRDRGGRGLKGVRCTRDAIKNIAIFIDTIQYNILQLQYQFLIVVFAIAFCVVLTLS